jgi:hypothetical protein
MERERENHWIGRWWVTAEANHALGWDMLLEFVKIPSLDGGGLVTIFGAFLRINSKPDALFLALAV